jgi:hypothetical protein
LGFCLGAFFFVGGFILGRSIYFGKPLKPHNLVDDDYEIDKTYFDKHFAIREAGTDCKRNRIICDPANFFPKIKRGAMVNIITFSKTIHKAEKI